MTWAGVDVGLRTYDVAVIDDSSVLALERVASGDDVARIVEARLTAVDAPRQPAADGERVRGCERALARAICRLRWTPAASAIADNDYYGWMRSGFALYGALPNAIECFPTATWTRVYGPRGSRPRGAWSRDALASLRLDVPRRLNQDQRDAIGAAWTARLHPLGRTESFGPIVVPL